MKLMKKECRSLARRVPFCMLVCLILLSSTVAAGSLSSGNHSLDYSTTYTTTSYGSVLGIGKNGRNIVEQSEDSFSYTVGSAVQDGRLSRAGSAEGVLTITNTTDSTKTVSFEWSLSYNLAINYYGGTLPSASVTFNGEGIPQGTHCSRNLRAGESIVIKVIAQGTGEKDQTSREATVVVSDFLIKDAEAITVSVRSVPGASTAVTSNEVSESVTTIDKAFTCYGDGETFSLNCTTMSGYELKGWMADGTFYPRITEFSYVVSSKSVAIYPVVLPTDYMGGLFEVNGTSYDTWDTAVAAAKSGGIIVLRENYSLPTTAAEQGLPESGGEYVQIASDSIEYILPLGVTLLVPYSADDTGLVEPVKDRDKDKCSYRHGGTKCTTAYKTLTVPEGVSLDCAGTLIVNGQVSGNAGPNEGTVFGTYGKMVVSGTLTVSGKLYARGYVVDGNHTAHTDGNGTGLICVKSGGEVYMPLQVLDYRGGNATSGAYGWIFPISQYKFQNIMLRVEYEYGSTLYGQYFTSVNDNNWTIATSLGAQMAIGVQPLIGATASCFVQMESGSVFTDYDYNTDQLIISVDATASFNDLTVSVTSTISPIDVTTKDKEIPIPYGVGIKVLDGAVINFDKKAKLLPGSWIDVQQGGTLNLSGSLYLYRAGDYQSTYSYSKQGGQLDVAGIVKTNVNTWNNDAKITVSGTLNITGSIAGSSVGFVGIVAKQGGRIISAAFAESGSIYEMSEANTDKVTVNFASVSGILAGRSDGQTAVAFSGSGAGTYHGLASGYWYQWTVSAVANGGSGATVSVTSKPIASATVGTTNVPLGYTCTGGTFAFSVTPPGGFTLDSVTASSGTIGGTYSLTGVTTDTVITLNLSSSVIYSLNISWAQTSTAVYTETTTYAWDTEALRYTPTTSGSWTTAASTLTITLDNSASTGAVNASFNWTADSSVTSTAAWDGGTTSMTLAARQKNATKTLTVTPTAAPPSGKQNGDSFDLGTVTITLSTA